MTIDRTRRTTFNDVADLYDEVRPRYPAQLIDDIIAFSQIPDRGRILEIGCGPGNATVAFAGRGYKMLGIELGARLAALAVKNCRAYPDVKIINASFEDWQLEEKSFDLVISAEAFHWIPPEIAYPKAAHALNDSGTAALFWIIYQYPETEIYKALNDVYRRIAPAFDNPSKSITPEWLTTQITGNFAESKYFGVVDVKQYSWSVTYTAEHYIKLISTFSVHDQLEAETRKTIFENIRAVIENFGGQIAQPYLAVLFQAKSKC
ncbi:MAG: class I SAM-dependent methyltransferase [Chloroflexi bacterium]|nr:class I SAM-dependent methyltransferase [Chloroflexota bacterium]